MICMKDRAGIRNASPGISRNRHQGAEIEPKCQVDAQHALVADHCDFDLSMLIQRYDVATTPACGKVDVGNWAILPVKEAGG